MASTGPGLLRRAWQRLSRPSARWSLLALLTIGFVAGVVFWGGFNTAMEATNTMAFCTSCHEMRDTVYVEYKETIHYSNRSGVRATCADCHVPRDWVHKMARKIQAIIAKNTVTIASDARVARFFCKSASACARGNSTLTIPSASPSARAIVAASASASLMTSVQ